MIIMTVFAIFCKLFGCLMWSKTVDYYKNCHLQKQSFLIKKMRCRNNQKIKSITHQQATKIYQFILIGRAHICAEFI